MSKKVSGVQNFAVLDALEKFHNVVKDEKYLAFTTIWNIEDDDYQHSNFASGFKTMDSFTWVLAGAIRIEATSYFTDAERMAERILKNVKLLADTSYYGSSSADDNADSLNFEDLLNNLKCMIECYERFKHDSDPLKKIFYSDAEKNIYCEYYQKMCGYYESKIKNLSEMVASFKEES